MGRYARARYAIGDHPPELSRKDNLLWSSLVTTRVVAYLHRLHARSQRNVSLVGAVIERSLGSSTGFDAVERRNGLIKLAAAAGVPAPEMMPVTSTEELRAGPELPWRSRRVKCRRQLRRPRRGGRELLRRGRPVPPTILVSPEWSETLKRMIVDRDPFDLLPWIRGQQPVVNL